MKKRAAYIGLGSNLGNRKQFLRTAVNNLEEVEDISSIQVSRLYETDPMGYLDQGQFLNLAVRIETTLSAHELLQVCQAEENKAERQRTIKDGPRTLDLDLLFVEGETVDEPDLSVPHPEMFNRGFVILPLLDLKMKKELKTQIKKGLAKIPHKKSFGSNYHIEGVWVEGELNLKEPAKLQIVKTRAELSKLTDGLREESKKIGFVPTMGALHKGHLSLIEQSILENDVTVISIFVNPLQFNKEKDLETYPNDLDRDIEVLECFFESSLILFIPSYDEMYPMDEVRAPLFESHLFEILEGEKRPGHLEGVCHAVSALFSIVGKCRAYFGEKDWQQLLVVSELVQTKNFPVEIVRCKTVREENGLAISSRNILLKDIEVALEVSKALFLGKDLIQNGETNVEKIVKEMKQALSKASEIEYLEIRDENTLMPVTKIGKEIVSPVRILIAAKVGEVRLIDNIPANTISVNKTPENNVSR